MERISKKTSELAVECGYPNCNTRYYDTQYSLSCISDVIYNYSEGTCKLYSDIIPALYQAELQDWLRDIHGISVLVELDETLSYYWVICPLHPAASIDTSLRSNDIWCGQYENCLEDGLYNALKLLQG